jgi:hypothetical protein
VCLSRSSEFRNDKEILPLPLPLPLVTLAASSCGMKNSLISRSNTEAEQEARSELDSPQVDLAAQSSKLKTFSKMSTLLGLVSVEWVVVELLPLLKRPFVRKK